MFKIILFVLFCFFVFCGVILLLAIQYARLLQGHLFVCENEFSISAAMHLSRLCNISVTVIKDPVRTPEKDARLALLCRKWNIEVI